MITAPATAGSPEAQRRFAYLSAPLVVGLFVPGLPVLSFVLVPPMAFAWAPQVWPQLTRGWALLYGLGVAALAWLLPVGTTPNLLIPLCATDWVGTMVPALAATAAYAVAGRRAVTSRRPRLWLLAALLVPVVHTATTEVLVWTGLASDYVC